MNRRSLLHTLAVCCLLLLSGGRALAQIDIGSSPRTRCSTTTPMLIGTGR